MVPDLVNRDIVQILSSANGVVKVPDCYQAIEEDQDSSLESQQGEYDPRSFNVVRSGPVHPI